MDVVAPTPWLSRFVEDVRVLVLGSGRALQLDLLPDGRTTLVLRVMAESRTGDVSVTGPRTRAKFKHVTSVARAIIVTLKPGWTVPVLGVAANALTDRIVPLEELWGSSAAELFRELVTARSPLDVVDRLSRTIARRADETFESSSARLARRAVRLLEGGEVRVESVAKQLGVSARHLRRAFTQSVGIGPKEFARTVRLQRALRRATTSQDWGRIATDVGYYDQAHLIADFRDLVGLTPSAFAKRALDESVSSNLRREPMATLSA